MSWFKLHFKDRGVEFTEQFSYFAKRWRIWSYSTRYCSWGGLTSFQQCRQGDWQAGEELCWKTPGSAEHKPAACPGSSNIARGILSCISRNVAMRLRKGIVSLYWSSVRLHLEYGTRWTLINWSEFSGGSPKWSGGWSICIVRCWEEWSLLFCLGVPNGSLVWFQHWSCFGQEVEIDTPSNPSDLMILSHGKFFQALRCLCLNNIFILFLIHFILYTILNIYIFVFIFIFWVSYQGQLTACDMKKFSMRCLFKM